ncbi:hypothetical protein BDA99DRAFT_354314 [Phascolomyces articulosus]|uniref:Protein-lysine N-methyltransferase EFM4 n=1 Tax=Phascolomyces articulosus TaxID=60185 RepID=A0AAD5KDI0_9FUNG|nr:hypothetical protein BDA99DRAFT_354314 [Phascolomyces articulosus]
MGDEKQDFEASKLGTKEYWDKVYDRENNNFNEIGDIGEIWFGEDSVEKMVDWVTENVTCGSTKIVDLGCGNGHLLLELAGEGYQQLMGIDYSESAITLAKAVAKQRELDIQYETVDLLGSEWASQHQFDLVLDKGTFDAISLHPDQEQAKKEGRDGPRERYVKAVREMINPDGLFLITSCNWTQNELTQAFQKYFRYHSHVKYPTFSFGGHSGSKICTVAFEPLS